MSDGANGQHQPQQPGLAWTLLSVCLSIPSLPRWVSRLVTAKTKYTLAHKDVPDKEEGNEATLGWELGSVGGVPMG